MKKVKGTTKSLANGGFKNGSTHNWQLLVNVNPSSKNPANIETLKLIDYNCELGTSSN